MNKVFLLLLSALLIIKINSETLCEHYGEKDGETPINEDVCRRLKVEEDYTHCCYIKQLNKCWQLTDDEYENIKRFKDYAKHHIDQFGESTDGFNGKLTIKCSANILSSSLFILFSLFGLLF